LELKSRREKGEREGKGKTGREKGRKWTSKGMIYIFA